VPNILSAQERKEIISEINGSENTRRKNDSLKRYDIYQKRQEQYLREQLREEYSSQTVSEMRIISSINLARRIVDERASLYVTPPTRNYERSGNGAITENEEEQLENLARFGCLDESMKKANRYYKLEQQCALQILPKSGAIKSRVLLPHHYDVIGMPGDPESAYCYIISVYDRSLLYNTTFQPSASGSSNYLSQGVSDGINQIISDGDDELSRQRLIWWTAEWNFITDGRGNIIDEMGRSLQISSEADLDMIRNPIATLPFVDIATEKEFEFWVRQGNDVIDFALDFSVLLSDTAEINKRQGYSQAIIYSEELPASLRIGPDRVLHMKQDRNSEKDPKFEWASPAPDMQGALELLRTYLVLFLTSEGMDPKTVSAVATSTTFASGVDRLLALIDKFEASADDISLFERVEQEALDIMVKWSNLLQGATIDGGVQPLRPELQTAMLPEDLMVNVIYVRPQAIETATEAEASVTTRMEAGLMSRKGALMKLDGISEEEAVKRLAEIDAEESLQMPAAPPPPKATPPEADDGTSEADI
jgi:hypothetical protein